MKCPHCQTDIHNRGNCPWGCDVDALPQNASVDSRSQHDPSPVGRTRTTEHERKLAEATKQRDEWKELYERLNESLASNKRLFSSKLAEKVIDDQVKRIKFLEDKYSETQKELLELKGGKS